MNDQIILVDQDDNQIGLGEKLKAHQEGRLHRAFSIFIFNSKGQMLLQQRAYDKYHSGGLWSNTCCSHPRPNRTIEEEARDRLKEEMGIDRPLKEVFNFYYKIKLGNLFEHEIDHVFIGHFDGEPVINREEAADWKWADKKELQEDINKNPEKYTYWFRLSLDRVLKAV